MSPATEVEVEQSKELMSALKGGDDQSLEGLVRLWETRLLRFAERHLQDAEEARDIVQEVFFRVYQNRGSYQEGRSFHSWAYTIAANLCSNRRRWRRRRSLLSLDWLFGEGVEPADRRATPEEESLGSERVAAVRAALAALPEEERTALLLHEYENFGYREIATVLNCGERAVERLLLRARQRLRNSLAEWLH